MNVLIIGANGFIGSNLTEFILRERDWSVSTLDIASDKLDKLTRHARFEFVRADITVDHEQVDESVAAADVVLPLAAIATPISYVRHPLRVFELTFEANLAVVRACVRHGKRVIFPSSSEVYGMSSEEVFDEETTELVLGPIDKQRWIYACSKQLLDRVITAYAFERGLRYSIFRPFNWIGPRLDDVLDAREGSSRVLTQFIGNIMRGEDLRLVDGGYQRRCFLYVDDAIDCLMRIIENTDGCADQQIFNVGNPWTDISIAELAKKLLDRAHAYPDYAEVAGGIRCVEVSSEQYYGAGYQDIKTRKPSIRKAWQRLGWRPTTDLDSAIEKTMDYYMRPAPADEEPHRVQTAPEPHGPSTPRAQDRR